MVAMINALLLVLLFSQAQSSEGTVHVSGYGIDSPTCGLPGDPCRSISRAVANARPGARILVGPGRYGDVDADGHFDDPGDEAAEVGFGCFCVLKVNKSVRIESRDGAEATVIDAPSALLLTHIVQIASAGSTFGAPGRGFAVSARFSGAPHGVSVLPATSGVTVAGNRITTTGGVALTVAGSGHTVFGNTLAESGLGAILNGDNYHIEGNVAAANGSSGMNVAGNNHRITRNLFVGNRGHGLAITGNLHLLRLNNFLGNYGSGVSVSQSSGAVLSNNNIFGNVQNLSNCGLLNTSGSSIDASSNFWGSPAGPGPDPADLACDQLPGSFTITNPPAHTEFVIQSR